MDSLRRLALTPVLLGIHAAYLLTEQIASAATSSTSARPTTPSRHSVRSPKHVAFSIVTSHGRHSASSRDPAALHGHSRSRREPQQSRKGKEKAREGHWTEQEACVLETVREAVAWALQNEVDEISLWNEDGEPVLCLAFDDQCINPNLSLSAGILEDVLPGLLSILVPSPPTPPASGSCSPPRFPSLSRRRENGESIASTSSSSESTERDDGHETNAQETQSYTVWPDMEEMLRNVQRECRLIRTLSFSTDKIGKLNMTFGLPCVAVVGDKVRMKPLSVHILPTFSSEDLLADITRNLVTTDTSLEAITIEYIDGLVRGEHQIWVLNVFESAQHRNHIALDFMHFQNDPELLIVHHTAGSSRNRIMVDNQLETHQAKSWRHRALSRLASDHPFEIHGYPFWMLRITEI